MHPNGAPEAPLVLPLVTETSMWIPKAPQAGVPEHPQLPKLVLE